MAEDEDRAAKAERAKQKVQLLFAIPSSSADVLTAAQAVPSCEDVEGSDGSRDRLGAHDPFQYPRISS